MNSKKVLISGASVGGITVAWWLSRRGFDLTVFEKDYVFRQGGQNVDVRGTGREVLSKMGLEQQALDLNTTKRGSDWVDEDNQVIARFAVEENGAGGPTAEMEIMHGDLSRIIYQPASPHANFWFCDTISSVEQDEAGAVVTFRSGATERNELVIIAEEVSLSTRNMNRYSLEFLDKKMVFDQDLYQNLSGSITFPCSLKRLDDFELSIEINGIEAIEILRLHDVLNKMMAVLAAHFWNTSIYDFSEVPVTDIPFDCSRAISIDIILIKSSGSEIEAEFFVFQELVNLYEEVLKMQYV